MEKEKGQFHTGVAVSIVGLFSNVLLAGAKLCAGFLSGLVSVVADGFNNLSDCGSCLVSLVSFRIAQKPADEKHPFGHQRAEYIAALCIAFLVLGLAVELFRKSVLRLVQGGEGSAELYLFPVLCVSILVKAGMGVFYAVFAKKTNSEALRAAARDSVCDCFSTGAALLGALLSRFSLLYADGAIGIFVAVFIFFQGVKILTDASSKLLGQAPDRALVSSVRACISEEEGVLGLHDLRIYPLGAHKTVATVHIECDAKEDALVSHERIDRIERAVSELFGVELTAHLDPVALDDAEQSELEERVRAAIEGMAGDMDIHDFRIVRGAKTKLVFEVGIPFSSKLKERDLKCDICRAVRVLGDYEPVVTVERE